MTQVGEVIFSHRRKKTRWLEWALKVWSMMKILTNEREKFIAWEKKMKVVERVGE